MNSPQSNELVFGLLLKQKRIKMGMSQEALSEISGISRSYISKLEKGDIDPGLYSMMKLASALKIKISHFVDELEHNL